jgi:hypothetical protein
MAATEEILALRLGHGENLHEAIAKACGEYGCDSAVVLSGVGMLRSVEFGWFTGSEYLRSALPDTFELASLSGDVSLKEGILYPHLHVVLNRKDHSVVAGHLLGATVDHNLEIFLKPLTTVRLDREFDGWFDALSPVRR